MRSSVAARDSSGFAVTFTVVDAGAAGAGADTVSAATAAALTVVGPKINSTEKSRHKDRIPAFLRLKINDLKLFNFTLLAKVLEWQINFSFSQSAVPRFSIRQRQPLRLRI